MHLDAHDIGNETQALYPKWVIRIWLLVC